MMRVFRGQKGKVLAAMPQKAIEHPALLNIDDETEAMVRIFSPMLLQLAKAEGEEAMRLVGVGKFDPDSPAVRQFLKDRTFRFSFAVNTETNRRLGEALAAGIKLGESVPQLRKRVSDVFRDMERPRSVRIARTETIRASNFATEEAYKQSGVVEAKEWLTALDERTCPFCEEMNGKVIGLGENYHDKGDTLVVGDEKLPLDFEDIEGPPLHPFCRCTLIPVVK